MLIISCFRFIRTCYRYIFRPYHSEDFDLKNTGREAMEYSERGLTVSMCVYGGWMFQTIRIGRVSRWNETGIQLTQDEVVRMKANITKILNHYGQKVEFK